MVTPSSTAAAAAAKAVERINYDSITNPD